jgi:hypothetical protein
MLGLLLVLSYGVLAPIENEFLGTGLAVVAYGVAYWLFYHAACRRLAELRPIRVGNFL